MRAEAARAHENHGGAADVSLPAQNWGFIFRVRVGPIVEGGALVHTGNTEGEKKTFSGHYD